MLIPCEEIPVGELELELELELEVIVTISSCTDDVLVLSETTQVLTAQEPSLRR